MKIIVMSDACQNCQAPIPAHLEAEYCTKCADMDYGFMEAGYDTD